MAQLESVFAVGGAGFVERALPREEPTALGLAMANAVREAREREEREAAKMTEKTAATAKSKRCTRCKQEKAATLAYFTTDRNRPDGLQRWCKACHNDYRQEKRQRERKAIEEMRAELRKAPTRPLGTIPTPKLANPLPGGLSAGIAGIASGGAALGGGVTPWSPPTSAPAKPRELDVATGGQQVSLADFLARAQDKPNAVLIMGRASVRLTEDGTAAWLGTRDGKGSPEAIPLSLVSWALSTILSVPADTLGVMFS